MLAPLGIKDARSGKWVRRGHWVVYPDHRWRWLDWRYRHDVAELFVQGPGHPRGIWVACAAHLSGLVWIAPT